MTIESSHDTRRRERLDTGLYRRTTARGETRYDVVVWQGGRQQVRALSAGTSERDARKAALRARAVASTGTAPRATARRFRDVVDEYLEHADARTRIVGRARMSETTVNTYRPRLRDYVTPVIGARKLSELGKVDALRVVDGCHDAKLSEGSSPACSTRSGPCSATHASATTSRPIRSSGCHMIGSRRNSRPPRRALRPEDAALVLSELRNPTPEPGKKNRRGCVRSSRLDDALGCLLTDAGLRASEARGITWDDVELLEGVSMSGVS